MNESEATSTALTLDLLCDQVRNLIQAKKYRQCEDVIRQAFYAYPHAPELHNWLGILLEKEGDHVLAMKHFRASWALDPTYLPARCNMENYGTFFSSGKCAYTANDCDDDAATGKGGR